MDNSAPYGPSREGHFPGLLSDERVWRVGVHFNGLEEFHFPSHCSFIKETLKRREKVVLLDINRPPLAEHHTTVQSVSIWTAIYFSVFWLFSSTLDFKRNNGFKVLTFSFKGVWGCSHLYWANSRTQCFLPSGGILYIKGLKNHGSLDVNVNTLKIKLKVSTSHSE